MTGPQLMQPVFDLLDGLIRDYGDILFMVFAYVAIPLALLLGAVGRITAKAVSQGNPRSLCHHHAQHTYWPISPGNRHRCHRPSSGASLILSLDEDGDSFAAWKISRRERASLSARARVGQCFASANRGAFAPWRLSSDASRPFRLFLYARQ